MAFTTYIKNVINEALRHVNLKLDTLTAQKLEAERIVRQIAIGQFEEPVYPLLDGMSAFDGKRLSGAFAAWRTDVERLIQGVSPMRFDRTIEVVRLEVCL